MSRYMWVVRVNDMYLGTDLQSITSALVTAHLFHSAEEADKWCPQAPFGTLLTSEVVKILVFVEEIR